MGKLIDTVERLMKDYPYRSQSEKESKDIVISVKLFDIQSTVTWWLSEYDPKSKIAFGYVLGFIENEWGTIPIEELEELDMITSISNSWDITTIPRIEVDKNFDPTKFPNLPFNKRSSN